jgi:hypothetical protein
MVGASSLTQGGSSGAARVCLKSVHHSMQSANDAEAKRCGVQVSKLRAQGFIGVKSRARLGHSTS